MSTVLWCNEEVSIVRENIDCSLSVLCKLLLSKGYDRSYEAIRKQKRRLLHKEIQTYAYSEDRSLEEEYGSEKAIIHHKTTLVIPDCHVTNDTDLSRFTFVSKLIERRRPDTILLGGDFADMLCLNSFDKNNKLAIEGRRLKLEIDAVNEALDKLLSFKKIVKDYTPRLIYLEANHEFRISRYVENNPALEGVISTELSFKLKERGFEFIPYKKFVEIEGVLATHVPLLNNGLGISGKYACQKAADLTSKSLIFFHTHTIGQFFHKRHGSDDLIQIYNPGCFFDGVVGSYAEDISHADTPSISILTHYKPGRFDIEQISLDRLKEQYK